MRLRRGVFCLLVLLGTLLWGAPSAATGPEAVVFSLDGNAYWFFEELLARQARSSSAVELAGSPDAPYAFADLLAQQGFGAPSPMTVNFPSLTAPGHATLFTGAFADVHGVAANSVFQLPHSEYTLLDLFSGFDGDSLLVPPVWIHAARHDRTAVVYQATQEFPMQVADGRERRWVDDRLVLADSLGISSGSDRVIRYGDLRAVEDAYSVTIGQSVFYLRSRGDTVLFATTPDFAEAQVLRRDIADLAPLEAQTSTGPMQAFLSWFGGSLETADIQLYQSQLARRRSNHPELLEGLPGPLTHSAGGLYTSGAFGKPLSDGGDGRAEELYLQTVLSSIANWETFFLAFQDKVPRGDLEIYYLPFPDEMLHLWAGYILPDSGVYDAGRAEQYWRYFETAMNRVARLIERVGFRTGRSPRNFFLVADHGFDYVTEWAYINMILEQAGLLAWKDKYTIDLSRTRILMSKGGCFLNVNRATYAGGIVPEEEVPEVLEQASRALLAARDASGKTIVRNTWPASLWRELGTGGPRGGDLYLELEPGFYWSHYSTDGAITSPRGANSTGEHGFWPLRLTMQATFVATTTGEPFVSAEGLLQTQIVPTVDQILRIPDPPYVQARPIPRVP